MSVTPPVGLLSPVLDGRASSYFEWLPAGRVETDTPSGTMTGGEHRHPEAANSSFRVRPSVPLSSPRPRGAGGQRLNQGLRCAVSFTTPADYRLVILGLPLAPAQSFRERGTDGAWMPVAGAGPKVAASEIIEVAIPFADVGLRPTHRSPSSSRPTPAQSSWNGTPPIGLLRASSRRRRSKSCTGRLKSPDAPN